MKFIALNPYITKACKFLFQETKKKKKKKKKEKKKSKKQKEVNKKGKRSQCNREEEILRENQ